LGGPDRDVKKPNSREKKDSRECPYDCEPYLVSYILTWVPGDILSIFGSKVLEGSSGDVLPVDCRHALDCLINDIPLNFVWKTFGRFSSDTLLEFIRESLSRLSSDILLGLGSKALDCLNNGIPFYLAWKNLGRLSSDVLLELIRESLGRLSSDTLLEFIRESLDCVSKNSSSVLEVKRLRG